MSRAIVTCGVSQVRAFGAYLERFKRTFAEHGRCAELRAWSQDWPPGSPSHVACHYAFKVWAVQAALDRGHDRILWLDCSCYAVRDIEPLWERLERDGHILIEDSEPLGKWCGDHALAHFGATRDDVMDRPLLVGTCWGLDFRLAMRREFFAALKAHATPEFLNGTHVSRAPSLDALRGAVLTPGMVHPRPGTEGAQMSTDARCWGHRSDEAIMTLLARSWGLKTHVGVEFSGGMPPTEKTCVRSGYDLA